MNRYRATTWMNTTVVSTAERATMVIRPADPRTREPRQPLQSTMIWAQILMVRM